MRLLRCAEDGTISLTTCFDIDITPAYAILSHTWGPDENEASFEDFIVGNWLQRSLGAKKIQFCAEQAKADGLEHFWVDTCCINKSSSSELQEAINSMFDWYRKAEVCYVYLTDVRACDDHDAPFSNEQIMAQFRRKLPIAESSAFDEEKIVVSCNHDASELTIAYNRDLQIYKPPRDLIPAEGELQAAAIKAFVNSQLGVDIMRGKEIELHWVVPLMTSDSSKMSRRDASINAGFSSTSRVLSQVEAVGSPFLYLTNRREKHSGPRLSRKSRNNVNMLVLLCADSGCELAAFTLDAETDSHKEIALSRAVAAGWNELEESFRGWMLEQFGAKFSKVDPKLTAPNSEFMNAFELHVSELEEESTAPTETGLLTLEMQDVDDAFYDHEYGQVILDRARTLCLLSPIIGSITFAMTQIIIELRNEGRELTHLKLLGNFIGIPYVRSQLEMHARSSTPERVRIDHQQDASVTVGAIIREAENLRLTSTKSLRHYGCIYDMKFREGVDPPRKAYMEAYHQIKLCKGRVAWLIKKGQDIIPHTVAVSKNTYICDPHELAPFSELRFVTCVLDHPPAWLDSPGVDDGMGIIVTQFTADEVRQRFTYRNGRYGLESLVKLSLGNSAGVLQAERVEETSGLTMGKTMIRFE
ncbi:hypothetical protein LTR10_000981 [Elasticomyces elasticus]|nr:hypothetical protein LTR10_000981 [Elasticomyces elasticus]